MMWVKFMKIADLYIAFINDRASYCAPDTIRYYRENLSFFISWLQSVGIDETEQLLPDVLRSFVVYLRDIRKVKATSIHTYFRAIYAFFHWMVEDEYIQTMKKIKLPRQNPETVLPLSQQEAEYILETISSTSENPRRDALIFRLMLDCGLRRSEVLHLRCCDVNREHRLLMINDSKFNKSRIVPVPEPVLQLIGYQFLNRNPDSEEMLLLHRRGGPLTKECIKQFFEHLKKRSGIQRIHAHLLRHTFGTSYMSYRGNLEYLRIYMGHETLQMTLNYVHLSLQLQLSGYQVYKIDDIYK